MTMADGGGLGDLASQLGTLDSDPGVGEGTGEVDPGQETPPAPKLSAFAQNYLDSIEADDQIKQSLIPHIQNWDKGFQTYAQRMATKYGQYDQLGQFEDIQRAVQLRQMFANDPHAVTQWLIEQGYGPKQAQPAQQEQDPLANLDPAIAERLRKADEMQTEFERMRAAMGALYERTQNQEMQAEVARHEQEIEAGLNAARTQHGFSPQHEVAVLNLMKGGMEMDQAIQTIAGMIQTGINKGAAPSAPKTLRASSLPPTQKRVSDMTDDERVSGLAAMLGNVLKD